MDPNDTQNILQYLKLFGHAPAGITPENLKLIQALQAAKAQTPTPAPQTPVPRYNNASPGMGGAISDVISAAAHAAAPRSITQQQGRLAAQEAANQ